MAGPSSGKVQVVPFVHKLILMTDGVTAGDVITDVPLPEVESWGPGLVGITAHTLLEQATTGFQWRVVMYSSIDGINWSAGVNLFTASTATTASGVVQTQYATPTSFGLHIRFAVVCSRTGATSRLYGTVTCALAFEFKS